MEIKIVKVKDIVPYENNSKEHPKEQVDKIKKSIQEFGFNVPVILDKNKVLIAGHGRHLAAIQLGMKEIPAIMKEDLTPNQIKAYRIADNKTAESKWNIQLLTEDIKALKSSKYDLGLTGFDLNEINNLLEVPDPNVEEEKVDKIGSLKIKCPKCGHNFSKGDGSE